MGRRPVPRDTLIEWIETHIEGCTSEAVKIHMGWRDKNRAYEVLASLRERGLVLQYGRGDFSRWCTPKTAKGVLAWQDRLREETRQRELERKRKPDGRCSRMRQEDQKPVFVARWVFDLGDAP